MLPTAPPENLFLVAGPDGSLDFNSTITEVHNNICWRHVVKPFPTFCMQVKRTFSAMYPADPFLPRVPDPEDVIVEGVENS